MTASESEADLSAFRTAWDEWRVAGEAAARVTAAGLPNGWTPSETFEAPSTMDVSADHLVHLHEVLKAEKRSAKKVRDLGRPLGLRGPFTPPHLGGSCPV